MALQEKNTSCDVAKNYWHCTLASLHYLFIHSKNLPFISALVVSNKYLEIAVLSILMDYFSDSMYGDNQRVAAIFTNLQDGLSSLFLVIVSLVSEAYTGYYSMITFCTAASIQGLMLLWTSTAKTASQFRATYASVFFLALGSSGHKLLENFFEYQLQEKIKARQDRKPVRGGSTQNKKEQDFLDKVLITTWMYAPCVFGYVLTVIYAFIIVDVKYEHRFRFSALLMGGTYMLFLAGSAWYSCEELPNESNLSKIFRIFKAALRKRDAKYPTSPSYYNWKNYKHDHVWYKGGGVRLLPRVPRLFGWLDKAAVLEEENSIVSPETQVKNQKVCTVREVREVKSLIPMFYLCIAFFGYSLLLATGNTFFVSQASNMRQNITSMDNDIPILFLIKEAVSDGSRFICFFIGCAFRRFTTTSSFIDRVCNKKAAIIRIGFGMVCAVACSLIAWRVEVRRLKANKSTKYDEQADSTVALIPQFSLMGMTEGFVEDGIASLFRGHVVESMWSFEDAFGELVIGSGKLLMIPLVLGIPSWFHASLKDSRLDRFYLMLGILNAVFFLVFGYYSFTYAYKEVCPEDEELREENADFVQ